MENGKKKYSLRMRMMEINVGIALVSLLSCGILFIFSVSFLIRKYINHDLDFFLTETGGNLEKRLEYLSATVNGLRHCEAVMRYLEDGVSSGDGKETAQTFSDVVDINDAPNHVEDGKPIIDRVYLFREDGAYLSEFYYALVPEDEEESNRIAEKVWRAYRNAGGERVGFETYLYREGTMLYLACPVLDGALEEKGSLVFGIALDTVFLMTDQIGKYEGAFWVFGTEDGGIIETGPGREEAFKEVQWEEPSDGAPYADKIGGEKYRLYHKNLPLDLRVSFGIPENHAVRILLDSLDIYAAGIVVVMLMGIISFAIFTLKMTRPIEELNRKMKQVELRDFGAKMPDYDSREFHEISRGFNQMTKEIDHLINEVYEKQILVKEMELKFLQTQMNPHFMFNVLNALGLQAKIDGNEELSRKISAFSQLIQAKIYRSDTEKVRIRQEMEYVKYYLEIQNFRYGDSLTYSVGIEEGLEDYYIPKLCIQLVVENAVVHGLEPKLGGGNVRVKIRRQAENIQIVVKDNGVGFGTEGEVALPLQVPDADRRHNRVGLNNADSIIKMMYGKKFGIRIYSLKDQGTEVIMLLPADSGERDRDAEE